MTYAAEPYAQFVDDLLLSLTGGVARSRFTFAAGTTRYSLAPLVPLLSSTLTVFGLAGGKFARFQPGRDFVLSSDFVVEWRAKGDGTPAPDAVWPDDASAFFANYDTAVGTGAAPLLTDRNTGSVTRLLSESFAREFAVVSQQLESVYQAAFLDTATGRDLDQLVRLVGLNRRTRSFATGSVIFSSNAPATGDIPINAGTRLSTQQPPLVVFETSEHRVLRRGDLTVDVPVRAIIPGPDGVVSPRAIAAIHRPLIGIASVSNAQGTTLAGEDESDDALRTRASRALEGAGESTLGALTAALASLPGVKEKFIRLEEDHLTRPGVVVANVAAELTSADASRAVLFIDQTRPAGVRVIHNIDAPPALVAAIPPNAVEDPLTGPPTATVVEGLYQPMNVRALVLPVSTSMSGAERAALQASTRSAISALLADAGIGETVVYNRVVSKVMAIDGVLDVAVELYPKPAVGAIVGARRQNFSPLKTLRPKLEDADLVVEIASEIVAFDIVVTIQLTDFARATGNIADTLADARVEVLGLLQDRIGAVTPSITPTALLAQVPPTISYHVTTLDYTVQYLEAGLVVNEANPSITLGALERPWVRNLRTSGTSG
ncbi:MAG: baseplate J/gp47 family protein [Gemmatimonadaceae bacterium]